VSIKGLPIRTMEDVNKKRRNGKIDYFIKIGRYIDIYSDEFEIKI